MKSLIFASSYNENSKVDAVAKHLVTLNYQYDLNSDYINIGKLNLPICDGYLCYKNQNVIELQNTVKEAHSVIFCSPIYNYDVNAITKNLIELCGQQLHNKVIGIAVVAGGEKSYMSPMSFINSLMLDFRCIVVPRFVYVTGSAFNKNNDITCSTIKDRLSSLSKDFSHITKALHVPL